MGREGRRAEALFLLVLVLHSSNCYVERTVFWGAYISYIFAYGSTWPQLESFRIAEILHQMQSSTSVQVSLACQPVQ